MFIWRKRPHSELGSYIKAIRGNQFVNINWHIPEFSSVWVEGKGKADIIEPGAIINKMNNSLY